MTIVVFSADVDIIFLITVIISILIYIIIIVIVMFNGVAFPVVSIESIILMEYNFNSYCFDMQC